MTKFLTSILFLSLVACGQSTTKQDSANDNKPVISGWKSLDQPNYTIQYPPTWELDQSGQAGTSFILFSPLESDQDQFKDNVNLMIQDLAGKNIDLNKYAEISEGQIKTMITNSNLVESKRIKNDNEEYHKLIYTGDQGVYHLKYEQYFWVVNDKAYLLTFTAEQDKFDGLKETGGKILNSFAIKK